MSAWSFIAQRATSGEWLDWDVPLELGGLEWQLSGPGSLKAKIAPDVGGLRASDGSLILEEWGTLLHAEHDGVIRWSGIVISSSFNGEDWDLEAAGLSTYPHRRVYRGEFSEFGVDPAAVIRHLWAHIQSHPDANLKVQVTGATYTGIRMGTPAQFGVPSDRLKAARDIAARLETDESIFEDFTWTGCPSYVSSAKERFLEAMPPEAKTGNRPAALAWFRQWIEENQDKEVEDKDAEPYALHWSESVNTGAEIDDLAKLAPLDWVESHRWDAAKEAILHEVQLHYPRAGRRRDDLVFSQGDNVISIVTVESNGDDFANSIIGLGAGEGRAMLRRETGLRDGRLLVDHVYADKAVSDPARLDVLIAEELNARKAAIRVEKVDVIDHLNAPIGSWGLGDDVLVRADLPWLGEVEVWCRVVGWSLTGENTASLDLVRSDLYRYGGTPVDSA